MIAKYRCGGKVQFFLVMFVTTIRMTTLTKLAIIVS